MPDNLLDQNCHAGEMLNRIDIDNFSFNSYFFAFTKNDAFCSLITRTHSSFKQTSEPERHCVTLTLHSCKSYYLQYLDLRNANLSLDACEGHF